MIYLYIVGINGSPNEMGETYYLLNEVLKQCEGCETEIINVGKCLMDTKTPFCINCSVPCNKSCYKGTDLETAYDKMAKANAIVFGSPVYFGSMSGQLKTFFDKGRALRGEKLFIGKPAAFVTCGASMFGGQESTIAAMHASALVYGMTILGPGSNEFDAAHLGVCAVKPAKDDQWANKRCSSLAKRILREINK